MKSAVLRMVYLVVGSIMVVFTLLMVIRYLGQGQEYTPLNHLMVSETPLVIFETTGHGSPQSVSALREAAKKCKKCVLRVDARLSLDDVPYVYGAEDLAEYTGASGFISLQTSEKISQSSYKEANEPILPLSDLFDEFPEQKFYVVLHSRDAFKMKHFLEAMKERENSETLIIGSPFRQLLKDVREKRPKWVFTTPPSYLMRIQMFEALHIETMADIWPDAVVVDPKSDEVQPVSGVIKEYLRRKKSVIVRSGTSLPDLPTESLGVLTSDLDFAASLFR